MKAFVYFMCFKCFIFLHFLNFDYILHKQNASFPRSTINIIMLLCVHRVCNCTQSMNKVCGFPLLILLNSMKNTGTSWLWKYLPLKFKYTLYFVERERSVIYTIRIVLTFFFSLLLKWKQALLTEIGRNFVFCEFRP